MEAIPKRQSSESKYIPTKSESWRKNSSFNGRNSTDKTAGQFSRDKFAKNNENFRKNQQKDRRSSEFFQTPKTASNSRFSNIFGTLTSVVNTQNNQIHATLQLIAKITFNELPVVTDTHSSWRLFYSMYETHKNAVFGCGKCHSNQKSDKMLGN